MDFSQRRLLAEGYCPRVAERLGYLKNPRRIDLRQDHSAIRHDRDRDLVIAQRTVILIWIFPFFASHDLTLWPKFLAAALRATRFV